MASLVHGSVMAIAGDQPDQALWANTFWWALLLLAVACWGRSLEGPAFGLLAALVLSLMPGLTELRTKFTLDLALTAACTWSLWQLDRWRQPAPMGGRWHQAITCGVLVAWAVLTKQSALLVLLPPCTWLLIRCGEGRRRLQAAAALLLVFMLCLPWLQHNWITTLGGTNRAVIESAAREGDPSLFSLANWLYYPRLLPEQLGTLPLLVGVSGALMALWHTRTAHGAPIHWATNRGETRSWSWLLSCIGSILLFSTLSPNKDSRYIAPSLPLLGLAISWGWWQWLRLLRHWLGFRTALSVIAALLGCSALEGWRQAWARIDRSSPPDLAAVVEHLRATHGNQPITVMTLVSTAEVNQHTLSYLGRRQGGQIVGRQLSIRPRQMALVRERVHWLLLAPESDDLSGRERALHRAVMQDPTFEMERSWPGKRNRLELWRRRGALPEAQPFDRRFIALARRMELGVEGVAGVFAAVGVEHSLDGHLNYQQRVERWADERLHSDPEDPDALWSLALLRVLQNRPLLADALYERLQRLKPDKGWPALYRSVVLLAAWRPWSASSVLTGAATDPTDSAATSLRRSLLVISDSLGGDLRQLPRLPGAIQQGVATVTASLKSPSPQATPAR